MDSKHIKELMRLHTAIMDIQVDVKEVKKISTWSAVSEKQWDTFNGTWSFNTIRDDNGNEITKRKCQAFGYVKNFPPAKLKQKIYKSLTYIIYAPHF